MLFKRHDINIVPFSFCAPPAGDQESQVALHRHNG